jgi:nicotinate phosphoribosyltransferase
MVYKLVARKDARGEWIPVAKASTGKASIGGAKVPVRAIDKLGVAVAEEIHIVQGPGTVPKGRALHVPLMRDGVAAPEHLGAQGVESARRHHAIAREELPESALRLGRGEPALPTEYV